MTAKLNSFQFRRNHLKVSENDLENYLQVSAPGAVLCYRPLAELDITESCMQRNYSPLKNLKVASPCSAEWNEMYGDDRKRHCGDCKLNVYNLSGMTKDEAEALVMNAEGRLCVRFYRREDGSILTQDCPVGWAKIKQRTKIYATAVASLIMALFTGVLFVSLLSNKHRGITVGELIPFATPTPQPLMGAIAAPPPNTNTNANTTATPRTKFEVGKMRVIPNTDRKDS